MKNKKGFTLVEVLAVITILGLLSGIVIVSVSRLIEKNRLNYYQSQEKLLRLAGQTYSEDNRNKMPKEVGNISLVKLRTLKEGFYINTIKDYKNKNCSYDNSYVLVHKKSINKYSYYAYLDCPDYKTDFNYTSNNATINIALEDASNYSNPTALVDITDTNGVASYEYIIYRNNKEIKNSGNIENKDKSNSVSFNVKFNKLQSGTYKLTVIAYDKFGAKSVKSLGNILLDGSLPTCGSNNGSTTWTKNDRTITVECSDEGSGCSKSSFSKTFNTDTKTSTIQIEDIAGNKKDCKVNVYVDKKGPSIKIINKSGKTDNLVFDLEDKYSGVASYQVVKASAGTYDDSKWISVNKSKATISTTQTTTSNYLVFAKDKVGNISMTVVDVQVGNGPKCEIRIVDGTKGNNGWYKSNVDIKMITSKGDNKISKYYLNTVENPQSNADGVDVNTDSKSLTKTVTEEGSAVTYYGYVIDKNGFYGTCSKTIKIDKTPPTKPVALTYKTSNLRNFTFDELNTYCPQCIRNYNDTTGSFGLISSNRTFYIDNKGYNFSVATYDHNWTNMSVYSILTSKKTLVDNVSGIDSIKYKTTGVNGNENYVKGENVLITNDSDVILKYRACDKAGNCSYSDDIVIKVDKTPPSCGSSSYYDESYKLWLPTSNINWTNKDRKIRYTCADNLSGCTDTDTHEETITATYNTYYKTYYDLAGNTGGCQIPVKVDKEEPSGEQIIFTNLKCDSSTSCVSVEGKNTEGIGFGRIKKCSINVIFDQFSNKKTVRFTFNVSGGWDYYSGVFKYQYYFISYGNPSSSSTSWKDLSGGITLDNGVYSNDDPGKNWATLKVRVVDWAGNVSTNTQTWVDISFYKN